MVLIILISNLTLIERFISSYIFSHLLSMPIRYSHKIQASRIAEQEVKHTDCCWKIQSIFHASLYITHKLPKMDDEKPVKFK